MYSFSKIAGLAATHRYHGDLALTRYFLPVIRGCLVHVHVILRQISVSYVGPLLSHGSIEIFVVACRSRSHVVSAPRYIIDERLTEPFRRDDFHAS